MLKEIVKSSIIRRLSRRFDNVASTARDFADLKATETIADGVLRLSEERHFSDAQRYELLYLIGRKLQPDFPINDRGRYLLADQAFHDYFERFSTTGNWKNFERRWNLKELLRQLPRVEGDLVECGVYEGAAAFQLCQFATGHGRTVHLFDSYQGLSAPEENDGTYWAKGSLSASEEKVHQNLEGFRCFKTYRGWIPEAFPQVENLKFAFLHVDVDLERPTFDSIAFFYPRMSKGGIILLDDHGFDTCPGARKAVLDYMSDKPEAVIDLSSGQGLIIKG